MGRERMSQTTPILPHSHSPIPILLVGFLLIISSTASGTEEIPHVSPEMTRAEYWIAKLPAPDKVLLTSPQIETLNQKFLRAEPTAMDPLTVPEGVNPSMLLAPLEKEEVSLLGKTPYDRRGRRVDKKFLSLLKASCALSDIPDLIPVRFGVIVKECSLRTFPTTEAVVEGRGKVAFDLLQQTTLHPGEPVAILWESRDREWAYLMTALLRGWVKKDSIAAFQNKKELVAYKRWPKIVVVDRTAPFYENTDEKSIGEWGMGTILHTPSLSEAGDFYRIERPVGGDTGEISFSPVYLRKEGVQKGFLPLTGRNILTQAFKLYGAPYGWGGLKGGWDCSSFLRDVFLTMGLTLPRNSGPQSRIGKILAVFPKEGKENPKKEALDRNLPPFTFVKLDNHIMLYLGKVKDRYYVIHSTAGYRKPGGFAKKMIRKDKVVSTFRVLVSDMELGKGSRRGSLMDRMISINAPFGE